MNPDYITEWLLTLAVALVAVAVAVAAVRAARQRLRIAASIAAVGDDALALICEPCNGGSGKCRCASKCGDWLCDPKMPGPGRPQPSGVSRHDDTGIDEWTPAQMAFIRGDIDELPHD